MQTLVQLLRYLFKHQCFSMLICNTKKGDIHLHCYIDLELRVNIIENNESYRWGLQYIHGKEIRKQVSFYLLLF